jgi:hypothetical protein
VEKLALAPSERVFLEALNQRRVRFLIVGMSGAILQGAPGVTQDIDLWFEPLDNDRIAAAAREAGGFWVSAFGLRPPALGGEGLEDRFDVVLHPDGLDAFDTEYARAKTEVVEGIPLRVLPLERIIASKRAAKRPKDLAQLPALEAALAVRIDRENDAEPDSS